MGDVDKDTKKDTPKDTSAAPLQNKEEADLHVPQKPQKRHLKK